MRAARRRTLTEVPNAVEDRAKFYTAPGPVRYAVAADGRGPLVPLPLSPSASAGSFAETLPVRARSGSRAAVRECADRHLPWRPVFRTRQAE